MSIKCKGADYVPVSSQACLSRPRGGSRQAYGRGHSAGRACPWTVIAGCGQARPGRQLASFSWPSGRRCSPAKGVLFAELYREFESLRFRQVLLRKHGVADGARTHDNRNHNPGLYKNRQCLSVQSIIGRIFWLLDLGSNQGPTD